MKIILPLDIENLIKSFVLHKCNLCKNWVKELNFFYRDDPMCNQCLEDIWTTDKYKKKLFIY